mgnify:CR=1 FL=1
MKKKIAILGSTGSIGKNTIEIIEKDKQNFKIELLSTNKNIIKIYNQAKKFKVKNIIIHDKKTFEKNKNFFKKKKIKLFQNVVDYFHNNKKNRIHYTMSSISGLEGLVSTLDIIRFSKNIAIANKESIVCGWSLIKKKLKKYKTNFIPVDSEHFSILDLIKKENKSNIKKIYITASGGPFLNQNFKKIKQTNPANAIKHPTWKMGKKISIDSSTLMNKVFELIEAMKIFDLKKSNFDIIIQPSSYVHAIVEFKNGVTKFLTHPTSMQIPIFNSLYNHHHNFEFENINFEKLNKLDFQKIDFKKFPINKILTKIPDKDSLFNTVLISANDTLVDLFLNKKISFYEIYEKLNTILNLKEFSKLKSIKPKNISQIMNLSHKVRLKTQSLSVVSKI